MAFGCFYSLVGLLSIWLISHFHSSFYLIIFHSLPRWLWHMVCETILKHLEVSLIIVHTYCKHGLIDAIPHLLFFIRLLKNNCAYVLLCMRVSVCVKGVCGKLDPTIFCNKAVFFQNVICDIYTVEPRCVEVEGTRRKYSTHPRFYSSALGYPMSPRADRLEGWFWSWADNGSDMKDDMFCFFLSFTSSEDIQAKTIFKTLETCFCCKFFFFFIIYFPDS